MVTFEKGTMQKFVAQKEFSLNFEDRKIKSVKVRVGEFVLYDGDIATYPAEGLNQITARCPSLKAAINSMGWMTLSKNGKAAAPVVAAKAGDPDVLPGKDFDYDTKLGGSFDTFLENTGLNNDGVPATTALKTAKKPGPEVLPEKADDYDEKVGGSLDTMIARENKATRVIPHEDRVVRKMPVKAASDPTLMKPVGTHPVSNDQYVVKESNATSVTSSTSQGKTTKHSTKVISAGQYGASSGSIPIKGLAKKASAESKRKTFEVTVDSKPLPDDVSVEEAMRATGRAEVTSAQDNAQEARVVKKVGQAGPATGEADMEEVRVVKKVGDKPLSATAEPAAETRIVKRVGEKAPVIETAEGITLRKTQSRESFGEAKVTAGESMPAMGGEVTVVKKASTKQEEPDYLSMLPDDWSELHWVKKEKFILAIEDVGFVEFILSVETTPAIINACKERLKQLGQQTAG